MKTKIITINGKPKAKPKKAGVKAVTLPEKARQEIKIIKELHAGITADAPLEVQVRLSLLRKAVDRLVEVLLPGHKEGKK